MLRKNVIIAMLAVVCCALGAAANTQVMSLMLLPDTTKAETYLTVKKESDIVRVDWIQPQPAGVFRQARVYYSASPQGGDISKYKPVTKMASDNISGSAQNMQGGATPTRMIRFSPGVNGMGAGVYYCMVAFEEDDPLLGKVTYYSPTFELMVASVVPPSIIAPKAQIPTGVATIDDLTPVFSWSQVDGVPYYHVILSDEPIPVKELTSGGTDNLLLKLSIVWQAITPNTRIAYGSPDPSGTITASPPPLSPGKEYSWMVLNNYGNQLAHTDGNAWGVPATFRIRGEPLNEPQTVSPRNQPLSAYPGYDKNKDRDKFWPIYQGGDSLKPIIGLTPVIDGAEEVKFRWTNLDTKANSYLVNLFMYTDAGKLGVGGLDELQGAQPSAAMLVWETTVSMPTGSLTQKDTLDAVLRNAKGTLTGGDYEWRVYARESNGAATTGSSSLGSFRYVGVPTGKVSVNTMEVIGGGIQVNVGYVELKVEVISGPMQAPLAFYTDEKGLIARDFPAGTYRITAVKEGYNPSVATFNVKDKHTESVTVQMRRPDATIYGRVVEITEGDSVPINLAKVTAVSGNDTVSANTNGNGYFTLSCKEASWTVTIEKAGYGTPRFRIVTVDNGQNFDFGTTPLSRNPFSLSGTVRNSRGAAILGARVRILREGVLVDELVSTPQNGSYSFLLPTGSYTMTAELAGFTMFSRNIVFTGTTNMDVTLTENAALINGAVIGRSWNPDRNAYDFAPIPNARVMFISGTDTLTVTSDATFGNFSLSVPGGRTFTVVSQASGFVSRANSQQPTVTTQGGTTYQFDRDTLQALARISGTARDLSGALLSDVDVSVYDPAAKRNITAVKTTIDGSFEIRNIPNTEAGAEFVINAGKTGYYLDVDAPIGITVTDGKPVLGNGHPQNDLRLEMAAGHKRITWNIVGYAGGGVIRITSPLMRTLRFAAGAAAVSIDSAGPAEYVLEAAADADTMLRLAYKNLSVLGSDPATEISDNIHFLFSHTPQTSISLGIDGEYTFSVNRPAESPITVTSLEMFYRSEGSSRYKMAASDQIALRQVRIKPDRDGCDLHYYFRIHMSNGDIYGSEGQVFSTYVEPTKTSISRLSVNPGASVDTLVLPSSYTAEFVLSAFYSDLFLPVDTSANIGSINWSVEGHGASVRGNGRKAELVTGPAAGSLTLVAALTPGNGYMVRGGRETVRIPINVTGKTLKRLVVRRSGEEVPISSVDKANFRVNAYDEDDMPVTVTPVWTITPNAAGTMIGGEFAPTAGFFGMVGIVAAAGGLGAAYHESDAELPGLKVIYMIRNKGAEDTADTKRGLRLSFPPNSLPQGQSVELRAATRPEDKNSVHRGGGGLRMADSLSYDIEVVRGDRLYDTTNIGISIDIPQHLQAEAASNPEYFKIARWYPDSLRWVELPSSEVVDGKVVAKLNRRADDLRNNEDAARSRNSSSKRSAHVKSAKKSAAKTETPSPSSQLHASARYAVVTKSAKLALDVNVSPNPFSPYIRPVKEYAKDYNMNRSAVPLGTCIKVNIEALEDTDIRSVKVHIYNVAGKRVWAIEDLSSEVGENRYWWDGRTTSREEIWKNDFESKGKMLRNGRYFVTVVLTDIEGRQKRVMKHVVLMK